MRLVSRPCIQEIPSGNHSCIAAHQANIPQPQSDLLAAIPPLFLTLEITTTFESSVDISIQPHVSVYLLLHQKLLKVVQVVQDMSLVQNHNSFLLLVEPQMQGVVVEQSYIYVIL